MGDDGLATVDLGDYAQVDRERQFDNRSFSKPEVPGLDEHAICTEVAGPANRATAAGRDQIDRGTSTMPRMQTTFHLPIPALDLSPGLAQGSQYAGPERGRKAPVNPLIGPAPTLIQIQSLTGDRCHKQILLQCSNGPANKGPRQLIRYHAQA
jgi:hypothetical protein